MGNIIEDIVDEKKSKISKGINEVYYKKDIGQGLLLIIQLVGISTLIYGIGVSIVGIVGSIASTAAGNPQMALRVWKFLSVNSKPILEILGAGGERLNQKYQELSNSQKKKVRTVVCLLLGHLHWIDLN